jgi:hypothetical protein
VTLLTAAIFEDYLLALNARMSQTGHKIALLLDNAPCHPKMQQLSNVHLLFLPPNTTAVTQPLDAGVIQNFKVLYRKQLLQFVFQALSCSNMSGSKIACSISVLQAVSWIKMAWTGVKIDTIKNCFRHCGIIAKCDNNVAESDQNDNTEAAVLANAVGINDPTFDEGNIPAYDEENGDAFEQQLLCPIKVESEESEEEITLAPPPSHVVLQAWQVIKQWHFFNQSDTVDAQMAVLDKQFSKLALTTLKPSKITDFFNRA